MMTVTVLFRYWNKTEAWKALLVNISTNFWRHCKYVLLLSHPCISSVPIYRYIELCDPQRSCYKYIKYNYNMAQHIGKVMRVSIIINFLENVWCNLFFYIGKLNMTYIGYREYFQRFMLFFIFSSLAYVWITKRLGQFIKNIGISPYWNELKNSFLKSWTYFDLSVQYRKMCQFRLWPGTFQ